MKIHHVQKWNRSRFNNPKIYIPQDSTPRRHRIFDDPWGGEFKVPIDGCINADISQKCGDYYRHFAIVWRLYEERVYANVWIKNNDAKNGVIYVFLLYIFALLMVSSQQNRLTGCFITEFGHKHTNGHTLYYAAPFGYKRRDRHWNPFSLSRYRTTLRSMRRKRKVSELVLGSLLLRSNSMWFFARGSLYDTSSLNEVRLATLYRQNSNTSRILELVRDYCVMCSNACRHCEISKKLI